MKIGPLTGTVRHRPSTAPMGRFGGGWLWKVGVQASEMRRERGTVIVSLVVTDITISWQR